jgi:mannose-1-phosphate guanylyltransferase
MARSSTNPNMKAVIFAGGIGSRMWPLSREATPKQFEKIINDQSTLQLTVARLYPEFKPSDIYISSGIRYTDIIKKQLPEIPSENIIGEPEMRDVAPAVGYVMSILSRKFNHSPVAILWSDHLVKNIPEFKRALIAGSKHLHHHPNQIVFLGQKARFPSQNLGWIEYGSEIGTIEGLSLRKFISWHYRPDITTAKKYMQSGHHAWNPGYFIVTPDFVMKQFQIHAPAMHQDLHKLSQSYGQTNHQQQLNRIYPKFEKISFDNLILEKIDPSEAVVISVDLGWSDLGAWEALKEALQKSPQANVTHGNIKTRDTSDSLIYSYTKQLVTTINLQGAVVVVTDDVILVTNKESIPDVKKMVNELKDSDLADYT